MANKANRRLELTEQDKGSWGPRDLKAPGNPEWCWQTVSFLQSLWKSLDLNLDRYLAVWAEAEEHKVWEKIPYDNPYGTKEKMLQDLALGDEARARARVAGQAVIAMPLRANGGVRAKGEQLDGRQAADKLTKADYLTARIARDRPDIWERMQRGEFKTVAAAAREAGIKVSSHKRVVVNGNNELLARRIKDILAPEEFRRFAKLAAQMSEENDSKAP